MRVLVTSDIHVHKYQQFNQGNRRLNNLINFLHYLFKLAAKNNIEYIIFTGDMFNNMQLISTEVENALIACLKLNFSTYPGIRWVAISGNHDHATRNLLDTPAISALHHLETIFPENFTVIDNNVFEIGEHVLYGIPYYEFSEHFMDRLEAQVTKAAMQRTGHSILLMHQLIGMDNPMITEDIDYHHKYLQTFHLVLNGHVHKHSAVCDNIINVGSPMHRDEGDVGDEKGILVLDLDTLEWDRILLNYPRFIHKRIGEELTEEEAEQFVIWVPAEDQTTVEEQTTIRNFSTHLKPRELITNFAEAVVTNKIAAELSADKEEIISVALKHVSI